MSESDVVVPLFVHDDGSDDVDNDNDDAVLLRLFSSFCSCD